jgi:hypothetical protein
VIFTAPFKSFPGAPTSYPYAPVLNVQIARPETNAPRSKRFEAIIDSGSSRCVFHGSIGEGIGLDVRSGSAASAVGITGKQSQNYLHDILLYVPGGAIKIRAAFSEELPVAGILGMDGFFQHFRVVFDPIRYQCEIERIHRT